jgi:hypothetical protein
MVIVSHFRAWYKGVNLSKGGGLNNSQEVQDDKDNGNDDQDVNPIAGLREATTDPATKKAKQPQDEQNYNDCPQHFVSPFY